MQRLRDPVSPDEQLGTSNADGSRRCRRCGGQEARLPRASVVVESRQEDSMRDRHRGRRHRQVRSQRSRVSTPRGPGPGVRVPGSGKTSIARPRDGTRGEGSRAFSTVRGPTSVHSVENNRERGWRREGLATRRERVIAGGEREGRAVILHARTETPDGRRLRVRRGGDGASSTTPSGPRVGAKNFFRSPILCGDGRRRRPESGPTGAARRARRRRDSNPCSRRAAVRTYYGKNLRGWARTHSS